MPTREKLESALRNAHAAGDVEAARRLATALKTGQYYSDPQKAEQATPKEQSDAQPDNRSLYERANDALRPAFDDGLGRIAGNVMATANQAITYPAQALGLDRIEGVDKVIQGATRITPDAEAMEALEKLRQTNPYLAQEIESMNPAQAGMIGMGEGFASLLRGVGLMEPPSESEAEAMDALRGQRTSAFVGKLVGQAAPFLVPAGAAANISSLPLRMGAMGGIGATEGGIISKGEGGSPGEVATGAGAGLLLGAGGEVLFPLVSRYGRELVKRVTGKDVGSAITPDGRPTEELQEALSEAGVSYDDLIEAAARDVPQDTRRIEGVDVIPRQGPRQAVDEGVGEIDPEQATNLTQRISQGKATPDDVNPDVRALAASDRLGVDAPLAVTSSNPAFRSIYGQMSVIPGSRQSIEMDRFFRDMQAVSDNLVEEMGGSLEKAGVSDRFRDQMDNLVQGARQAERELYDEIQSRINPAKPVDTSRIIANLEGMADEVGGVERLARSNPGAHSLLMDAKDGMTYGYLDDMIKQLNEAKYKANSPFGSMSTYRRDQLIDMMDEARQRFLKDEGLGDLGEQAKQATRTKKDIQARQMKLLGRERLGAIVPKVTASIKPAKVAAGDLKAFDELMSNMPDELKPEVMATAIDGVLRKSGDFNATQFSQWWEALNRSPEAKRRIFQHLPQGAENRMQDMYRLAKGLSRVQADRTKTGRVDAIFRELDKSGGIIDKIKGTAGRAAAAEGVTSAIGIPGAGTVGVLAREFGQNRQTSQQAAQDFLASDAFREAVLDYAKRGNVTDFQTEKLKRSKAYKQWLENQPPSVKSSIASIGLMPWLMGDQE